MSVRYVLNQLNIFSYLYPGKTISLLLCTAFCLAPGIAYSDDASLNYNQIELDARAQQQVDNDTMLVSLFAQEEGSAAGDAGNRVNEKINAALKYLKAYPAIKVETESYSTTPIYNKSQLIGWRVKQSILLESRQLTLMSDVIGALQKTLKLSGIEFEVSQEKREQVTKQLIDEALSAYQERAEQVTKKLGGHGYKIVKLNISTSGADIQPRRNLGRAMFAESAMAANVPPQMASGESQLTVTVRGTIELE